VSDERLPPDATMTPLKRAFIALEETRARLAAAQAAAREPIAIIGLGCRVPGGGNDAESFWALMRDGIDAIGPLPADRWDVAATYDPDPEAPGRIATTGGGFIGDVRGFDPVHFGITRREAQGMDPQQRLLLEVAWEALENAGQPPDRLERSATGVYVGVTGSDWAYLQFETRDRELLDAHFASGIAHSIVSGRLSYLLGLQGPALTIDTACSSSLVSIHLACQALRAGDCRMALAGGVNLILSPDLYIALSRSRMLAPDGRCKTFDATADGFARGEGCGLVVLKRLSDAQADGDRILAVIRGSAVNQDGPSSGLTAPNGPAQEAVIREALARAGVNPRDVGFIEAHGTGTQLGDPLEVAALGSVFGPDRDPAQPLLIGSVKTNVGHLEAAAGVTGLIKLVLSLRARALPAHLHFRAPSPHIAWKDWAVRVPTALTPWAPIDGRRIAGVSSFGFSGTNAHVVVEEAPAAAFPTAGRERAHLFLLSARDEVALAALARRYADAFSQTGEASLADICFSAATGRAHLPQRAVVTVRNVSELRTRLAAIAAGRTAEGVRIARVTRRDPARVAFLFTGQGAQYAGMARRLDETQPVFRAALDRCAAVLDLRLPQPLRELLFTAPGEASQLDETRFTQPALFAVEYALATLWQAWGIWPDVLMGHSVGELVAACLGGVLTLDEALVLVAERGRLMQTLPAGGAMAAIFASEEEVAAAIEPHAASVSIAAQNGPLQTVISGAAAHIDAVCARLTERGVRCQRLPVSHAFHSPLVDPVLDAFEARVAAIGLQPPVRRIVSNLTGRLADAREVVQPRYWRRHLREAVRFADGVQTLAALKPDVCLEIGPHPTLLAFAQTNFEALQHTAPPTMIASLRKGRDDEEQLDEALGALYLAGVVVDWRAVWASSPRQRVDLPAYPFQREPLWFPIRLTSRGSDAAHPLLGKRLRSALRDVVQFESVLRADSLPFIEDHQVQSRAILPATGFLEMGLAAGRSVLGTRCEVQDVAILEPLRFDGEELRVVQLLVRRLGSGSASFEVLSSAANSTDGDWHRHAEGRLATGSDLPAAAPIDEVRERCGDAIDAAQHQAMLAARGLVFGPSLRGLRGIRRGHDEALGEIVLPEAGVAGRGRYEFHPALLDACLQVMNAAMPDDGACAQAFLPMAIESLNATRPPGQHVWSHARVRPGTPGSGMLKAEVTVYDTDGVLAQLRGIALRPAIAGLSSRTAANDQSLYEIAWEPLAATDAAWLPTPAALDSTAGARLPELAREHDLDEYQQAFGALEALCVSWVASAFTALGWRPRVGEQVRRAALAQRLGVAPRYERLLGRLLDILAEDGWLQPEPEGWRVARVWPEGDAHALDAMRSALLARHPRSRARIELAARCGPQLAQILTGAVDPLQQLFPGGSTELAESLYRDAPEAKVFNQLVREAVRQMIAGLPQGRRLRILEVGGGTGGTTSWVAAELPADRTDYLFTDIGPSLVAKARSTFASHGFMQFQPFDLEQSLESQGLAGRQFDLILASNVVHATADLRQTLGRLRALLSPGGTLLMLEVAGLERWIDVTFGLTDGWWRFTDTDLRRDYPLLSRPAWLEVLGAAGFECAAVGSPDARSREVLLAARKPVHEAPAATTSGTWLILADRAGVGSALAAQLVGAGQPALLVDPDADVRAVITRHSARLAGVVHLRSLDAGFDADEPGDSVLPSQQENLGTILSVVQALGACSFETGATPRLWIATRGAVALGGPAAQSASLQLAQSPMWGLGKVIALEHPELRCVRIDLDPHAPIDVSAQALCARLRDGTAEDQLARRGDSWYAARLARCDVDEGPAPALRLEKGRGATFDELSLRSTARRAPAAGEVEIRVVASGLNFRDVMNALAMRDDPEPLGGECAGRVIALGEGVSSVRVGDHVVAIAEASLATYTSTPAALVRRIPAGVGFAEAATLPFALMTAWHALHTLGGLRAGHAVLIHAGAGGVGMAAIQLAQAAGALIFATAGSDEKRAALRSLGVAHVLDSRSLAFAEQIRTLTQGRGVDLVLNSLAGEFIGASVRCLAVDGCFLEIGKRDIWTAEQFGAARPAGRYHAIDLAAMRLDDPAGTAALFDRVLGAVEQGALRPLPVQTFPIERAADAFRFMAMARHIGKVVLTQVDDRAASLDALDPGAAYLITGGLSGLGLLTASRLVERGARHLVLVGRRAPGAPALRAMDTMRAVGAQVHVLQADIARPDEVRRVLASVNPATPLRGIVHSAGVLEDGALMQQSWDRFTRPLGPKIDGAWALHRGTLALRLDFFVMYSSMASMLGSSGQGNHAAANAFMDALASQRRSQGRPGLSIGWGAWSEIGAAADRQVDQRVGAQGIDVITPQRGLLWLERLMRAAAPHVGVFPVRWSSFLARPGALTPFLSRFEGEQRAAAPAVLSPATAEPSILGQLQQAHPARRHELLVAFIADHVARVIDAPNRDAIDLRQPLNEMGLDSLMAVELRNRLGNGLGLARSLPATLVFDHPTLEALALYLARDVLATDEPASNPVVAAPADAVGAIDGLSDDEIEKMFAKKMLRS
jgi:acyl transferase domain-containing protein/NADPH:quinone reductase-like Zn-dependent oxidoreductase/NAD(P)-dependent dehydrogenase (short-subunit alcohol dehydrogenase family)